MLLSATASMADDDPFAYLENGADPRTQAFFREQGAAARARLDAIPGRAQMLERIRTLSDSAVTVSSIAITPTRIFYLKLEPRRMQPVLCVRDGLSGPERELVDPARFDSPPRSASIDWFVPSPDGLHVAYGVSLGASEDSVLRVVEVNARRDLPIEIDRARFNRQLAWHPDGRSFYYARVPAANTPAKRDANVRIYRHQLGRAASGDEIVFASGVGGARDVPEFVRPSLHVPVESRYAYAIARDGARREVAVHVTEQRDLAAGRPRWRKLAGTQDEVLAIEGWRDELYLLSKRGAPRHRVLRVNATAPDIGAARVMVAEGDAVVTAMGLARDALYLRTMVGGVDRLEKMSLGLLGPKAAEFVRTPFDNGITQLVADPRMSGAVLLLQGWIDPPMIVQVEAKGGNVRNTRVQPPAQVDFSAMDEVRLYAPARDGTRIPVTLLYRKTTRLTGQNPTLLVGYGAYGEALSPRFDPARLAWLERGGVYAVAHLRGGGEYGEAWHQAGKGASKPNTILDLVAVAEFLAAYGFANPKHLAIAASGAGGIAAGGALVRRPELFAAVVARSPLMDMLRYEKMAGGAADIPEFGSAASDEGAQRLRVVSAYHHVKDGTAYPGVLLTAGPSDPRVEPWQAGKMAARLNAATSSGKPVLMRVDPDAGHGPGAPRTSRNEELADIYAFLLWQLGDPQFQPTPTAGPAGPSAGVAPESSGAQLPSPAAPEPSGAQLPPPAAPEPSGVQSVPPVKAAP
ncbi:MAG: prolyl oligopeptidase family serine peptidase [Pseudomonadota bacterium]|nr:prolyl oligopeptidase family serine peptidase [Pseudomonadota bacterium]